jgi:hypothetical protein
MTELSPAAKAVLIAEAKSRCLREQRDCHPDDDDWNGCWLCVHRRGLAAALRAAADQVVPPALEEEFNDRNQALPLKKMVEIRQKLNAIATELEAL